MQLQQQKELEECKLKNENVNAEKEIERQVAKKKEEYDHLIKNK